MTYSKKQNFDKFYTKQEVVKQCLKYIDINSYDFVIEPSAGNGSFYSIINHSNKIGLDIKPEHPDIKCMDWFEYEIAEKYEKVLVIGNPPFGIRNKLSIAFLEHSCSFNNVFTIAFVLPDVFNKHTLQKHIPKEYRLKHIVKLPNDSFMIEDKSYHVPCSFFVFEKSYGECLRFKPELYIETEHWSYGTKKDYDFFVMGASINTVKKCPENEKNSGYYIKVKNDFDVEIVKDNFKNLKYKSYSSVNGGVAWLTRPEVVKNYGEQFGGIIPSPNLFNFFLDLSS